MLLNLKPIKTGANCYSNNWVLQICNYFGISYQPFFLRYFNDYLRIVNKNHSILDSDPSTTMGKKYPIEKLIGIKFKQVDVQGDYWSYVINEINNKIPVPISSTRPGIPQTTPLTAPFISVILSNILFLLKIKNRLRNNAIYKTQNNTKKRNLTLSFCLRD